ncbi:MAG TPA: helix-turn-helix domain-containing protein [Blastocatellia bacterium]|nr:helix-turn-helix domain-containing protein [Blastocatellia bacterium]
MENLTDRVTTKEAARILGVTDGRVRQMILKGQISAKRFGRALTLSRSDVESLRGRKAGRPKKERSAKLIAGNKLRKPRPKSLDEIIAESNVTPWTDADFDRASEIGEGLFEGFAEQVRRWRDQNEILEADRWARLGL